MADVKTTDESAAAALTGADLVRGVQSSANVKITVDQIRSYVRDLTSVSAAAALTGPELVPGVQSGGDVKITAAQLKTFASAAPTFTGLVTVGGGQIAFPATPNPSANANTLDDYEEGTWSATLNDGTNNFTISSQDSTYTKNGRVVIARTGISWSSIGSAGAAALRVGGLPFSNVGASQQAIFGGSSGFDYTATLNPIIAYVVSGGALTIQFERQNDNAGATALAANSCSASGSLGVTAVYHV